MAKSLVRKASNTSKRSKVSKKSVSRKSRKLVSKKSRSKRSKKSTRKSRTKKSKRSSKRVSYRMMPAARPAAQNNTIPARDIEGNIVTHVSRLDYEQLAEPYHMTYMRLTAGGYPMFYRSYQDAAMAAFPPSASGIRADPRVWVLSNNGTVFLIADE